MGTLFGMSTSSAERFALEHALRRIIGAMAARVSRKPIQLELDIAADVPTQIETRCESLIAVLEELLRNAITYTARGRVCLSVELLDLEYGARGSSSRLLQFGVHDTGPGIPPEECEVLFRSFSRYRGQRAADDTPAGLGLVLCKRLIEGMGGTIWLESQAGQGTSVYFAVAVRVPELAARTQATPSLGGVAALIIEEAPGVSDPLTALVERWGVMPRAMSRVDDILESVRFGEVFDLVLADIRGVTTPALRCARAVREHPSTRGLPFIAVAPASGTRRGPWTGFPTVLSSPVEPGALYSTIHRLLGRPRPLPA